MDDEKLWTARELAKFLSYSESTIARMVTQAPDKLPPRVAHLSRPRWLPSTVLEWAKTRSPASVRGRPRSV